MKATLKFDFYSDPGHGWAKVSKALLVKLSIADSITPYSYSRGNFAYLEEDCDLGIFYKALEDRGVKPIFKEHRANKYSKIRSYESYIVA